MQNRGQAERPLRGLCGISACSPWGKKSQSAAVIPFGAPSAWLAPLSDFMKIVNDSYTVMAIPYILAVPFSPGRPIQSWPSHSVLAVPHITSYLSPCAVLVCPILLSSCMGIIDLRTALDNRLAYGWDHRLAYGLGLSACVRFGTIGLRKDGLFK